MASAVIITNIQMMVITFLLVDKEHCVVISIMSVESSGLLNMRLFAIPSKSLQKYGWENYFAP